MPTTTLYPITLHPELDFPPERRIQALRHAADWVEEGAEKGEAGCLFNPIYEDSAMDAEIVAVNRCAVGEAMLFLHDDFEAWTFISPVMALTRLGEPPICQHLIGRVMEAFDGGYHGACATHLRDCAEFLERHSLCPA